jgi:L-ascorbate oxidase
MQIMIISRQVVISAMIIVLLSGSAFAQSNLFDRGFADLIDTTESLSDNAAAGGSRQFGMQGLSYFKGVNATGNSNDASLSGGVSRYLLYNPSTDSFDTVYMRSYNGCLVGPSISINHGADTDGP